MLAPVRARGVGVAHQQRAVAPRQREDLLARQVDRPEHVLEIADRNAAERDAEEFAGAGADAAREIDRPLAGRAILRRCADEQAGIGVRAQMAEIVAVGQVEPDIGADARAVRQPAARVDDREGLDLRQACDLFLQVAMHRVVAGDPVEGLGRIGVHLRDRILDVAQDQVDCMDRARGLLAEDQGQIGDVAPRVLQGVGAQLEDGKSHSQDRDCEQHGPCHHGRHVADQRGQMAEHELTIGKSHCATIKVAASRISPRRARMYEWYRAGAQV